MLLVPDRSYEKWIAAHTPTGEQTKKEEKDQKNFTKRPLISIVTPVYNPEIPHLKEAIASVVSQSYDNWELILIDDCSPNPKVRELLVSVATSDPRIHIILNKKNLHIAKATNKGIEASKGSFIGLLDHDDVLYKGALYKVVTEINRHKDVDFIYTDEDHLSEDGKKRTGAFFKPDWSPDFLRSINYITHFTVIKKSLLDKIGLLDSQYDGAQDWDLFLRATREAKNIRHIPNVLYGWRMAKTSTASSTSAKPYVVEAQKKALVADIKARGLRGKVQQSSYIKDYWSVSYEVKRTPLVSIVIPSKNQYEVLKRCIDSIIKKSTYKNYEIVLVDTGSDQEEVLAWYPKIEEQFKGFRLVDWPEKPFSYARSCNEGARQAKGDYVIMLNNDTEVITPNWIELMLGDAQRSEVGSVGARLYYPGNHMIQHAGIGIGLGGYAANLFSGAYNRDIRGIQALYANNKRDVAAVTAACLMMRRDLFLSIGGFDEAFRVTYNDVDLGLRILNKGLLNIYNPAIALTHHESISVGRPDAKARDTDEFIAAKALLVKRWKKYIQHDPYYNANLSKDHADFRL